MPQFCFISSTNVCQSPSSPRSCVAPQVLVPPPASELAFPAAAPASDSQLAPCERSAGSRLRRSQASPAQPRSQEQPPPATTAPFSEHGGGVCT